MENIISGLSADGKEIVYTDFLLSDIKERTKILDELVARTTSFKPTKIVCFLEKGAVLASLVAFRLGLPIVVFTDKARPCVRYKSASLANKRIYVIDGLLNIDDRVVMIDDYLGSGVLAKSAIRLIKKTGALPVAAVFVVENQKNPLDIIDGVEIQCLIREFTMMSPKTNRKIQELLY
jgi:adenine/guanine phosphoribosyltransferase-like PRPP-binding protein